MKTTEDEEKENGPLPLDDDPETGPKVETRREKGQEYS